MRGRVAAHAPASSGAVATSSMAARSFTPFREDWVASFTRASSMGCTGSATRSR